jgi:uncharacterized membrane protein
MNTESIITSPLGGVHTAVSVLAMLLAAAVLALPKGTQRHTRLGYGYAAAMLAVNLTAFGMYRLFGKFGPFHLMACISLATLAIGMVPMWMRRAIRNWRYLHMSFMYWSAVGLYCAFFAEMAVRLPHGLPFFQAVAWGTGLTMAAGMAFFISKKRQWLGK